ncbi:MAG TPA: oligosaccharide flippase family protein [Allosphingosinicella sp.]|nr:oligosaccharide flippase family protein [Allosphingosinicella sp.]
MSVRRSLAWYLSAQVVTAAFIFGGAVAMARLLTPIEMGIYAVAFAISGVVGIITAGGTAAYVIRERELGPGQIETAFMVNAALCVALAAALVALSYPAAAFLGNGGVGDVMRVLALRPLLMILEFRPSAMLQRDMQFKRVSLIATTQAGVNVAGMIALALAGFSYMSMAYATVAASAVSALLYNAFGREHCSLRMSVAHWRTIATFGARMLSISGVAMLATRVSEVVMGRLLGLASLGIFTRASQISDLLYVNVYGACARIAFVKMAQDDREAGSVHDTYRRSLEMITALLWPALAGIAVLSYPVIQIVYGERWLGAALPLSLLMVAQMIHLAFSMSLELFVLKDETAKQTKLEFARAAVSLFFFTIGSLVSIGAAAAAKITEAAFGWALYKPHIQRLTEVASAELWGVYSRSAAATAAAIAPALLLMAWTGWSPHTPVPMIAAAVTAGVALWLAALHWLRHPLRDEIVGFATSRMARDRSG